MVTINLLPAAALGPVFDPEATGVQRWIPRRPWWPVLPVVVLAAPLLLGTFALNAICRRLKD